LTFRQALREPLLHFMALGLGLFLLHALVATADTGGDRIVITGARVTSLAQQYQQTWNRSPTPEELRTLIDSAVRNEVLFREGKALGLDLEDAVIERRVRQKYELISEEEGAGRPPSDADLAAYLKAHAEKFRQSSIVSFDQILFEATGNAEATESRIAAARAALARGAAPDSMGDVTMLPHHFDATELDLVSRDFGERFADALGQMPIGSWGEPVVSGFGVHLVRVTKRSPATLPPLAEIRAAVAREWENDRRIAANEARYRDALKKYSVMIEGRSWP